MKQAILPNRLQLSEEEYQVYASNGTSNFIKHRDAAIPGYMFANTGIVHAVNFVALFFRRKL